MKLLDNKLFVEFAEMVECGVSANYLRKAKSTGTKCWTFIDDPADKRKVLIEFETLKEEYKTKIAARYGNPYERLAKQPIRDMIKWDDKAEEFYLAYRYTGTDGQSKPLPIDHVKKHTGAASFLNMLKRVTEDKKALKQLLKLNIEQFYLHCLEIIEAEKIDLPTSYKRLVGIEDSALKKYVREGYKSLIDWRFGNQTAAKVNDEVSKSVLMEMIAHPNQYDDVLIAMQYNKWAKENGYKTIEPQTVGQWRRKTEKDTIMFREGNAELKNKYLRQVKGFRPTAPLFLVESDDNHLDLLFLDPDDKTQSKYYNRYVAVVVTDSFNDYVLGYAYAKKVTNELVRAAYLSAEYHIKSLTGGWYLPHEVKTDRWGLKELQPFYEGIGKYFPTPVGSKNRGYIENFFGSPLWKNSMKLGANNYNGNNMTAKHRGVNTEALDRNKKNFPLIGSEADQQIESFFHRLRHMPQSNGLSKQQQWLQAWEATAPDNKRLVSDEQLLLKFGITHAPARPIRITNRGVEPEIGGVRYSYDLQTPSLMEYVGKPVNVVYDPFDMSRVLVTDFEQVRLMGVNARLASRSLQDAGTYHDSRKFLNSILAEKQNSVDWIADRSEGRKQVLKAAGVDPEGLLQAGVMVKELKQSAERAMIAHTVSGHSEDYFEQM